MHLKGLCAAGELREAEELLSRRMPAEGVAPNVRTLNAFLRGCARVQDAAAATRVLDALSARGGGDGGGDGAPPRSSSFVPVEPDASAYETLASLLAHELHTAQLDSLVAQVTQSN